MYEESDSIDREIVWRALAEQAIDALEGPNGWKNRGGFPAENRQSYKY